MLGSVAFFDQWIQIREKFFPDPGSVFWVKNFFVPWLKSCSVPVQKLNNLHFVKFTATKIGESTIFPDLFCFVVGSEIQDPGWKNFRIRDKPPRSKTLAPSIPKTVGNLPFFF
jgi:hypothetical protein